MEMFSRRRSDQKVPAVTVQHRSRFVAAITRTSARSLPNEAYGPLGSPRRHERADGRCSTGRGDNRVSRRETCRRGTVRELLARCFSSQRRRGSRRRFPAGTIGQSFARALGEAFDYDEVRCGVPSSSGGASRDPSIDVEDPRLHPRESAVRRCSTRAARFPCDRGWQSVHSLSPSVYKVGAFSRLNISITS